MYGDSPCIVLERAGLIDLAFLKGGHHLFVVNQQTYFVFETGSCSKVVGLKLVQIR